MSDNRQFLIIGASQAGGWVAKTLRTEGFEGSVILIGEEPYFPYERPPLSKGVLAGDATLESTYFWTPQTYDELNIDVRLKTRVTKINRGKKQLTLDDGETLNFDRLAITTGARARNLSIEGSNLKGIFYLRTMADTQAIRANLTERTKLLIVGGGWIGLECASTLKKLNCEVTIIEAADRLCGRAVTPEISDWMLRFHTRHGIEVKLNTTLNSFFGGPNLKQANLSNGEAIKIDMAIIGIGVIPNVELAEDAGLEVDNGIVVDIKTRTSDPNIFAAGDVTNHPNKILGRNIRLESWENAQNQGIVAGRALLDLAEPYAEIPWFWSDQFDANIQMIGLPENWDSTVTRGEPKSDEFITFYLKHDQIIGAISINDPRNLRFAKRLMQAKKHISVDDLANTQIKLQSLMKN